MTFVDKKVLDDTLLGYFVSYPFQRVFPYMCREVFDGTRHLNYTVNNVQYSATAKVLEFGMNLKTGKAAARVLQVKVHTPDVLFCGVQKSDSDLEFLNEFLDTFQMKCEISQQRGVVQVLFRTVLNSTPVINVQVLEQNMLAKALLATQRGSILGERDEVD